MHPHAPLAQPFDPRIAALGDPGVVGRAERDARRPSRGERPAHDDPLDQRRQRAAPPGVLAQPPVEASQHLRLRDADRRVRLRRLPRQLGLPHPQGGQEPRPQEVRVVPGRRRRHDVDPLRRQVRTPHGEDPGRVEPLHEPGPARPRVVEVAPERRPGAELERLLPSAGQLARQVACRQDDVDLGPRGRQVRERPRGLVTGGLREHLVADDDVAPRAAHPSQQPAPGAVHVPRVDAVVGVRDLEGRPVVQARVGEPPERVAHAVRPQAPAVGAQARLQIGRARLRCPDMKKDPSRHDATFARLPVRRLSTRCERVATRPPPSCALARRSREAGT